MLHAYFFPAGMLLRACMHAADCIRASGCMHRGQETRKETADSCTRTAQQATCVGGYWGACAQDTVDKILEVHGDKVAASSPCRTKGMKIQGAVDPRGRLAPEVLHMLRLLFSSLPLSLLHLLVWFPSAAFVAAVSFCLC